MVFAAGLVPAAAAAPAVAAGLVEPKGLKGLEDAAGAALAAGAATGASFSVTVSSLVSGLAAGLNAEELAAGLVPATAAAPLGAAGLLPPTEAAPRGAAAGLVVRVSVFAEPKGLKGLEGDAARVAAGASFSAGASLVSAWAAGLKAEDGFEPATAAAPLGAAGLDPETAAAPLGAAGLVPPTEAAPLGAAGLVPPTGAAPLGATAGLAGWVSFFAEPKGLKGLAASENLLYGEGAGAGCSSVSFFFFSLAGLNALGIPAGEYVEAELSRFAAAVCLNGLGAPFWCAASAVFAELMRAKIDALSLFAGSTFSGSFSGSSRSEPGSSGSLRPPESATDVSDLPHFQQYLALFGMSSPHSGHEVRGAAHFLQNFASSGSSRPQFIQNINCLP